MSNKLGKKVKEIRKKKGMSQQEFAESLGYTSKSTINKIEEGINDMSYDKLILLIKKYELSLGDLLEGDKKK
jgi:transcriptional regulator with XRE-family HTH domain